MFFSKWDGIMRIPYREQNAFTALCKATGCLVCGEVQSLSEPQSSSLAATLHAEIHALGALDFCIQRPTSEGKSSYDQHALLTSSLQNVGCDFPKNIEIPCYIQELSMTVMGPGEIGWWLVYGRFMP